MRRFPYQLWVNQIATDAVPDNLGNYSAQAGSFSALCPCRDVVNSAGSTVTLDDQTVQVYDYLIVLPKTAPAVASGALIKVLDTDGSQRVQGTVKRFYRGQLGCKLWV